MEYLIVILLIILIFKEDIIKIISELKDKEPEKDELEAQKSKLFKKEFDKMMEYSVEDAIKSKRSEIDG